MIIIRREEIQEQILPGRIIQKAVGKDSISESGKITMGFGRYCKESGPMEPHQHAEEVVYIAGARDGWVAWGDSPDNLDKQIPLEEGMTLHFGELEWHVFKHGEDGFVDILFIYGQVDNIRPEEILKNREQGKWAAH